MGFDLSLRNNFFIIRFCCSTCFSLKMNRYSVEKLRDQRNHYYYYYYYYYYCYYHHHHHHLSVKGTERKIESTCAVDTYDAKSKLPIEFNILHSNIVSLKLITKRG